ncbi:hypothetical protein D3C78_588850 [compost metagenome]
MGAYGNGQVRLWQNARTLFWPLEQTQRISLEIVANAHELQFLRIDQAIQVEMVGAHLTDLVGFNHGEGRAFHCTSMAQAPNKATGQRSLARAQVALEKDDAATAGHLGQ